MMYIIDESYRELSDLTASERALMDKAFQGVLVAASLADEFDQVAKLSLIHYSTVNVTISGAVAFAPGFHEQMDDFQTTYLRIVTSKSYLDSLGFHPRTTEAYVFVNTRGNVLRLKDALMQWLHSVSIMGEPLDYSVEARVSTLQTSQIEGGFISSCAGYLVFVGLAAVIVNVAATLDEKRFQLRVIKARGTTERQIATGLSVYYLSLAIPMVFLGVAMTIVYTYAAVFAPVMLTHESFSSCQFQLPSGYVVVVPIGVVLASIGIILASIVANYVLVNRYLKKKRIEMEED